MQPVMATMTEQPNRGRPDSTSWGRFETALIRGANRLADLALGVDPSQVLNPGSPIPGTQPAVRALKKTANAMHAMAFDPQSGTVNYVGLAQSEAYSEFRALTRTLPACSPDELGGREQRLAFWINLYNALILDAVIRFEITGSLLEDRGFFRRAAYNVCGLRFSADDIEHGLLRGNQPHPVLRLPAFGPSDPRLGVTIDPPDPRLHFALVCGARSCPPIAFYDGDQIDQQLDQAAASFMNSGGVHFAAEENTLWVSKLLDWYKQDFGGRHGVLQTIRKYIKDPEAQSALEHGDFRVRFMTYDWSLNGSV